MILRHGTRCAGQIAAQGNNSVCIVGIAHNAQIGGKFLYIDKNDFFYFTVLFYSIVFISLPNNTYQLNDKLCVFL